MIVSFVIESGVKFEYSLLNQCVIILKQNIPNKNKNFKLHVERESLEFIMFKWILLDIIFQ